MTIMIAQYIEEKYSFNINVKNVNSFAYMLKTYYLCNVKLKNNNRYGNKSSIIRRTEID